MSCEPKGYAHKMNLLGTEHASADFSQFMQDVDSSIAESVFGLLEVAA